MESPDSMIGKMEVCPVCNRRMKVKNPVVIAEEERRKQQATEKDIANLRQLGFDVPDDLTKEESQRLHAIWELRRQGVKVDEGTPAEEVDHLSRIVKLRKQGVNIAFSADTRELAQVESRGKGLRSFHTKVAGVSHRNDDGTSRQEIIADCVPLERLLLDHNEQNPHDPNAVRVCRQNGEQIGFLNAGLAEEAVRRSGQGYRYAAFVKNITGGGGDAPTLGVNLLIVVADPGVSDAEAQSYANMLDVSDANLPERPSMSNTAAGRKAGCLSLLLLCFLVLVGVCCLLGDWCKP